MKKFTHIKYLAVFFVTFAISFGITKAIGNFAPQNEGFTKEQAILHSHKKVQSLCNAKSVNVKDTQGRTVFIDKNDWDGAYSVVIDWDYSLRGRHELLWYSKEEYKRCIAEVGETEQ